MSLNFIFGSSLADLGKRYLLLCLLRLGWSSPVFYHDPALLPLAWVVSIPFPWLFAFTPTTTWCVDAILAVLEIQTLFYIIRRLFNRTDLSPDSRRAGQRRFARALFGVETRLYPLVKTLVIVTALRAGWIAINVLNPSVLTVGTALLPWPHVMYSGTVYFMELALVAHQLRVILRIARVLLLRHAPRLAALLGFSHPTADDSQHIGPRNGSWLPTALQFCGLLILTCCVLGWIALSVRYQGWVPFDYFMGSGYANMPFLVGVSLSILGFLFGSRYIGRASGDIGAIFGITRVPDDHWLAQRVHTLAEKLNMPKPAVGMMTIMNAYAMGSNRKNAMVVIGQPLFDFERDELDAIIGHELGHILHRDVARTLFAEGFQRMLVGLVNILTVFGAIVAASSSRSRAGAQLGHQFALSGGALVRRTVFVASELLAKKVSRHREFHADAVGAHVTSPDAMARALKRVSGVAAKPTAEERHYGYLMFRGSGFGALFSTHPSLEARLRALDVYNVSQEASLSNREVDTAVQRPIVSAPSAVASSENDVESLQDSRTPRRRISFSGSWANSERMPMVVAGCVALLVITPALVDFYSLGRRFNDARLITAQAWTSSVKWVADSKEIALATILPVTASLPVQEPAPPDTSPRRTGADLQTEDRNLQALLQSKDQTIQFWQRNYEEQLTKVRDLEQQLVDKNVLMAQIESQRALIVSLTQDKATYEAKIREIQVQDTVAANPRLMTTADAAPRYGAIASSTNGIVFLTEEGSASEQEATSRALAGCRSFAGKSTCRIEKVFANSCAAIARVDPAGRQQPWYYYVTRNGDVAEERALSECYQQHRKICRIVVPAVCM